MIAGLEYVLLAETIQNESRVSSVVVWVSNLCSCHLIDINRIRGSINLLRYYVIQLHWIEYLCSFQLAVNLKGLKDVKTRS